MFNWNEPRFDMFTPSNAALTPRDAEDMQQQEIGPTPDTTRPAQEESMRAGIFVLDGILTMLFFPLRLFKLLGADSRKSRHFFFPLGSKLTFVPLLSLLMWLCAFGIGLQLYSAVDPKDLRTLNSVTKSVSMGDAIVAITLFGGVALVVASAVSHNPRFVRWDKEISNIMESVPFHRQEAAIAAMEMTTIPAGGSGGGAVAGDFLIEAGCNENSGGGDTDGITEHTREFADSPDHEHHDTNYQALMAANSSSATKLLDSRGSGGMSPPPPPLNAGVHLNDLTLAIPYVDPVPTGRPVRAEFETMAGPLPRRYIPFSHVLMDEVPPLRGEGMQFVYDTTEWFEPQRHNRQHLDRSLALFKEVWTQQQDEELNAQLERRRQRAAAATASGQPQSAATAEEEAEEMRAINFALINADSADWKPSDLFKFCIGDRVRRNGEMPFLEVSFDGVHPVREGDKFTISNRMWHEDCALYCVNEGVETHQWQAIEALFDAVEDVGMDATQQGASRPPPDKAIETEHLLLAMSGRDMLRRFDVYANGNVASSEAAMYIPQWHIAVIVVGMAVAAIIPTAVRVLQGGGLHASGTLGDMISAYTPVFLTTLAGASLLSFLDTTLKSMENYDDVWDGFTEVTLGASSNKWYPVMNWFETTNMRSWYHLRQHIESSFHVHYNSRLSACFSVLMLTSSWSIFGLGYLLTYSTRSRPTADGWLLEILLITLPMSIQLLYIFQHAAAINELFLSHSASLAQIQVALEEELMLVAARTVNKNPALQLQLASTLHDHGNSSQSGSSNNSNVNTRFQGLSNMTIAFRSNEFQCLMDAKSLLDDVRFAVDLQQPPLRPFGITVTRHMLQFVLLQLALNVVGVALVLAGFVLNSWRWKLLVQ